MTHELNCPHSGCPLLGIQNMSRVPELDIIEVLHREIEHLRATVARLRGAGFHPLYQVHGPGPATF
ncbi:MAG TPA: hypothetical protein VFA63_18915 [Pseudonocardiaceae bacterium]|jgi:hypothetical protein|nr:hypothetical protein [Pseudonocardiaceae bacterium]